MPSDEILIRGVLKDLSGSPQRTGAPRPLTTGKIPDHPTVVPDMDQDGCADLLGNRVEEPGGRRGTTSEQAQTPRTQGRVVAIHEPAAEGVEVREAAHRGGGHDHDQVPRLDDRRHACGWAVNNNPDPAVPQRFEDGVDDRRAYARVWRGPPPPTIGGEYAAGALPGEDTDQGLPVDLAPDPQQIRPARSGDVLDTHSDIDPSAVEVEVDERRRAGPARRLERQRGGDAGGPHPS